MIDISAPSQLDHSLCEFCGNPARRGGSNSCCFRPQCMKKDRRKKTLACFASKRKVPKDDAAIGPPTKKQRDEDIKVAECEQACNVSKSAASAPFCVETRQSSGSLRNVRRTGPTSQLRSSDDNNSSNSRSNTSQQSQDS